MHDQPRALQWDFDRSRYVSVIAAAFAAHPLHAEAQYARKQNHARRKACPKVSPEVFASEIIASHPSIRDIVIKVNYKNHFFGR
ncbi:hypothetical protein A0H81_08818 [Grifola frondosa]|uniref:Uncharacterized protein n=1 Tax=Grifola frondosa TaxID=5627 RepID=A0A1C7M4N6_GRIFR|nr:hypothetical protein A0H81_08818 [Grifola frondosa]